MSFPKRNEDALFAEIRIRHNIYDLFLFIEDEKMPEVYRKIINRLFNYKLNFKHVYPMNSKRNVLIKFDEWSRNASDLDKCFFIVDKDFNHLKGTGIPGSKNLIELEYYTIENYLVSKDGVLDLISNKVFREKKEDIDHKLDWENWLNYIYKNFKDLFIAYAIAFKYDLKENCNISPYRYLVKKSYKINEQQIIDYIESVKDLCIQENINYRNEVSIIESCFKSGDDYKYQELIKGKYIFAAMLKYLHYLFGVEFDEDMGSYIIADNMSLNDLQFIKRQILEK